MPLNQLSIALSLISNVKKAMEVIKTWHEKRDRLKTLQHFDRQERDEIKKQPDIIREASDLTSRTSPESLLHAYEKIDNYFTWYQTVLSSPEFFAGEVDDATKSLINCICTELQTLDAINENTPEGVLKIYWDEHSSAFLKET